MLRGPDQYVRWLIRREAHTRFEAFLRRGWMCARPPYHWYEGLCTVFSNLSYLEITLSTLQVLYKRKKLYGGFYILSMPPSPDYFRGLDPTRPLSEQVNKLPYFPEWEFPREKVQISEWICLCTHFFYRQLDFPSESGVANEILEIEAKSCLAVA